MQENKKVFILTYEYYNEIVKKIFEKMCNTNVTCTSYICENMLCSENYIIDISNNLLNKYKVIKQINPNIKLINYYKYILILRLVSILINKLQVYIRKNVGFEINEGSFLRIDKLIRNNILAKDSVLIILKKYFYYKKRLYNLAVDKPKRLTKVALVSQNYKQFIFDDYYLEKLLASKNIQVIIKYKYSLKKLNDKYDGIIYVFDQFADKNIIKQLDIPIIFIRYKDEIDKEKLKNNIDKFSNIINFK